jgi:Zn-dependent peptidase ImmA (M78 family)
VATGLHYRSPGALLTELGISEPDDLKIEAIAEYCNATVIYEPLKGSSARILGYGDRAFITVDSQSRRERQRFSIGHELGHWMRDRGKVASFTCTDQVFATEWNGNNPERLANQYATNLLLPEFMFAPRAKNQQITFETVRNLAAIFQMSLTATAIRLIELGSFPAMIVCHTSKQRRWFLRGPDVPSTIRLRDEPGNDTAAHYLLCGSSANEGSIDVSADGWIMSPDSRRYTLREDSIRIGDYYVLSLLWWKDERQLIDIEEDNEF